MSRFVYGSLMSPEVLSSLLGRVPPRRPATLRGYRRFAIVDRVYPAVLADETTINDVVDGEVLHGMTRRELAVLDWFEDEAYVLTRVDVTFADGGRAGGGGGGGGGPGPGRGDDDVDDDAFAAALNALSDEDAYSDERVVQAYVYTSDKRHELRGDWDYDAFRAEHLEAYVRMCDEFREDIEDNDLPGDDSSCEGTDDDA
jgi:gamma-glutamylcyclotransferase (GGCT)/AIG2-like uncharacterized protein YtfP